MRGITKRFPGVIANENVNMVVYPGEIHALLGENGAGKSTLMSVLTGLYHPDEGEIIYKGKKVSFKSPKDAVELGIGMVYQHFRLVDSHTVTENILLGQLKNRFFLNINELHKKVENFSKQYGLEVQASAKIWQLSVGEQQRVEIVKLLYRGTEVLILDEPTAVLTPQEVKELFKNIRTMASNGKAVIIITHKLYEVMEVADWITVLRNGKAVGNLKKTETNRDELTYLMVGREILNKRILVKSNFTKDVLKLDKLVVKNDKGLNALNSFSLTVNGGEILGIAGVAGNGQKELSEVISGLRDVDSGSITLLGKDITNASPRTIIKDGLSLIPENRMEMGLVGDMNITENMMLKKFQDHEYNHIGFLNYKKAEGWALELIKDFDIKTTGLNYPIKSMSGGNQQKLLLSREISQEPLLIIASYPSRGLDIGATETVQKLLLEQRKKGVAIILISEDLEEIFKLSDRVAVLYAGKLMGIVPGDEVTFEGIGKMMLGVSQEEVVI